MQPSSLGMQRAADAICQGVTLFCKSHNCSGPFKPQGMNSPRTSSGARDKVEGGVVRRTFSPSQLLKPPLPRPPAAAVPSLSKEGSLFTLNVLLEVGS